MTMTALLRLTSLAAMISASSSCQPLNGADPLDHGRGPAMVDLSTPSSPERWQEEKFRDEAYREAEEGTLGQSVRKSAGVSTSSDW